MRSVFLTYGQRILLLSSLFVTCKRDERTDYVRKIVSEWTGDVPFVITVRTTCGCTVPTWNQQPVALGATTEIKVKVKPGEPGAFRKTASVYGNIEDVPLQLLVIGEVTN